MGKSLKHLFEMGLLAFLGYITFFHYPRISYWAMINIFGMSERAARTNAGEPITGFFTFFGLLIVALVSLRIFYTALNIILPPSSRPSVGLILAVPPVNPKTGPAAITTMVTTGIAFLYLLII